MSDADVAIIGAGPAGLAAALELRRHGVARVLLLERDAQAGGVPRHCAHPPYGLREFGRIMTGPAYASRLVGQALAAGVQIRTLTSVTALHPGGRLDLATPDGRGRLAARRVLIATGARESPRAARLLSGERPVGVINTGALQACLHLHGLAPFRRPVILGTELVSLSAIATCRLHGIRPAAIVEPNPQATARWPLTLLPNLLGIPRYFDSQITGIHGAGRVDFVGITGPGGTRMLACDGLLLTGGFTPEAALIRASHLTLDKASGGPAIDQVGRCTDPAYFAAGNILRAVESAGWSFREGQRIGRALAADLAGALPAASRAIPIMPGAGIKLAVPQRLASPGTAGAKWLELRAAAALSGRLRVLADGEVIWRRRIAARPERRILIPLERLAIPPGTAALTVDIAG